MATTSRVGLLGECRTTIAVVEVNAVDFEHAQEDRELLAATVAKIEEADIRQKHHKFQFQQASRDLEGFTSLARDLLLRLKNSIRARYGITAEKLAEFGLNPRRSSRTSTQSKKKPPETGPIPPQTADSGTDSTTQK